MRRLQLVEVLEEVLVREHEQELEAPVERLDAVGHQESLIVTIPYRYLSVSFSFDSFFFRFIWYFCTDTLEVIALFIFF